MIALLVALVVIPGTVGDLLNSAGMKRQGEIGDWSPRGLLKVCRDLLRNRYIVAGIPAMAISFFALMSLISANALSFAVPITASSYILETAPRQVHTQGASRLAPLGWFFYSFPACYLPRL